MGCKGSRVRISPSRPTTYISIRRRRRGSVTRSPAHVFVLQTRRYVVPARLALPGRSVCLYIASRFEQTLPRNKHGGEFLWHRFARTFFALVSRSSAFAPRRRHSPASSRWT